MLSIKLFQIEELTACGLIVDEWNENSEWKSKTANFQDNNISLVLFFSIDNMGINVLEFLEKLSAEY